MCLLECSICHLTFSNRIDVRDQLKRLEKDPQEED